MTDCATRLYRDPAFLRVAYWGRGQSSYAIGQVCGVSGPTIRKWMRRHDIPRREREIPREDLLADIQAVADHVAGVPSTEDYHEHGTYSLRATQTRFGAWADALRAAGVFDD